MLLLQKGIDGFKGVNDPSAKHNLDLLEKNLYKALRTRRKITLWGGLPRMEASLSPINQTLLEMIRAANDEGSSALAKRILDEAAKYWQHLIRSGVENPGLENSKLENNDRSSLLSKANSNDSHSNMNYIAIKSHITKSKSRSDSYNDQIEGPGGSSNGDPLSALIERLNAINNDNDDYDFGDYINDLSDVRDEYYEAFDSIVTNYQARVEGTIRSRYSQKVFCDVYYDDKAYKDAIERPFYKRFFYGGKQFFYNAGRSILGKKGHKEIDYYGKRQGYRNVNKYFIQLIDEISLSPNAPDNLRRIKAVIGDSKEGFDPVKLIVQLHHIFQDMEIDYYGALEQIKERYINELIKQYPLNEVVKRYNLYDQNYNENHYRDALHRFIVYGDDSPLIRGKLKYDLRTAKERLNNYKKEAEKKLKRVKKGINRLAKSVDVGTRIVKQSHPLVAFVNDIENPGDYKELQEHLRKHQASVHSESRIWLVNKSTNKGKLYIIKPDGQSFRFVPDSQDESDLEDVPGFDEDEDDGGSGEITSGGISNKRKSTSNQPLLIDSNKDSQIGFSWHISYDTKSYEKKVKNVNTYTKKISYGYRFCPHYVPFVAMPAFIEEEKQKARAIKGRLLGVAWLSSIFFGIGEGTVALVGFIGVGTIIANPVVFAIFLGGAVVVGVCGFVCNKYLTESDIYNVLKAICIGKWKYLGQLFIDDDGKPIHWSLRIFSFIMGLLAIGSGFAYGVLSAKSLLTILMASHGLHLALGLALCITIPIAGTTAVGIFAIFFYVIVDFIKNRRWNQVASYFRNTYFIGWELWNELSTGQKLLHVFVYSPINFIRLLVAFALIAIITVASFGLFYQKGLAILAAFTDKNLSVVSLIFTSMNAIVSFTFGFDKTQKIFNNASVSGVLLFPIKLIIAIPSLAIAIFLECPLRVIGSAIGRLFGGDPWDKTPRGIGWLFSKACSGLDSFAAWVGSKFPKWTTVVDGHIENRLGSTYRANFDDIDQNFNTKLSTAKMLHVQDSDKNELLAYHEESEIIRTNLTAFTVMPNGFGQVLLFVLTGSVIDFFEKGSADIHIRFSTPLCILLIGSSEFAYSCAPNLRAIQEALATVSPSQRKEMGAMLRKFKAALSNSANDQLQDFMKQNRGATSLSSYQWNELKELLDNAEGAPDVKGEQWHDFKRVVEICLRIQLFNEAPEYEVGRYQPQLQPILVSS